MAETRENRFLKAETVSMLPIGLSLFAWFVEGDIQPVRGSLRELEHNASGDAIPG
jgi:hypothetical protein